MIQTVRIPVVGLQTCSWLWLIALTRVSLGKEFDLLSSKNVLFVLLKNTLLSIIPCSYERINRSFD